MQDRFDTHRERLHMAMCDAQENLVDFFTMTALERAGACWEEVVVEAPEPAEPPVALRLARSA